mmetsp:Transcript_69752/g.145767  ORF Transcript_69752/g.145767 Transcript_69752/m.145767 type:complete len:86 (+) Transcript_69752:218-475(+)
MTLACHRGMGTAKDRLLRRKKGPTEAPARFEFRQGHGQGSCKNSQKQQKLTVRDLVRKREGGRVRLLTHAQKFRTTTTVARRSQG